jgi:LytS/YehU family sensor histidine kinase
MKRDRERLELHTKLLETELRVNRALMNPHFIFNSLNTLSHLIEDRPEKAKRFNDNLAEIYRYILQNKARDLVLLKEEIEFVKHYFALLRIRFEEAVQLELLVDDEESEQFLIPPISLQILVENGIKHNEFSDRNPLKIEINLVNQTLVVRNEIRKKELRKPSSGIGLKNLDERYELITAKKMVIDEKENEFRVTLPVLKID